MGRGGDDGFRQRLGSGPVLQPFEHAQGADARFGVRRGGIERLGLGQFAEAFVVLRQFMQQLATAQFQPGVGEAFGRQQRQQLGGRQAIAQRLAAALDVKVGVHLVALAEGAGFGAEGHRLVLEDTQIGQHEVGPVLVQVAKEQQTQAIAEVHQRQPPDALRHQLGHAAGPAAERQGRGLLGLQPRQPVFLAPGLG